MADFKIRNPLNPQQLFTVSVTLRQMVLPSVDPSLAGETVWMLEAATLARDCDGNTLNPERTVVRSFDTVDEEINNLVDRISSNICWDYAEDTIAPYIKEYSPEDGDESVSINTTISISLSDGIEREYIATGIDKDSIRLFVKGYDVTDLITINGNLWNYNIEFTPGTLEC